MGVTVIRWLRLPPPARLRWIVPGPVEAAIAQEAELGPIAAVVGPPGRDASPGGNPAWSQKQW